MKGYMSALAFLLIISVLSSGCMELEAFDLGWIWEYDQPASSVCSSPALKLITSTGMGDKDHCYQAVAVNTENLAICEKITRPPPMTKCYLLIAAKKNDPSICDEIPRTNDPQAYLKVDCLWEVAMTNNNQAACEALGSERISRMFMGEMSKQTCLDRLASGQAAGGRMT